MEKIKILLIDDHTMMVNAWSDILNSDGRFAVIGSGTDAATALQSVRDFYPEVVLTDINMTPVDGFELTRQVLAIAPKTAVIGVSMFNSPAYAKKMIRSGALGYVTKNSSIDELKLAILKVSKGKKYICKEIKDLLVAQKFEEEPSSQKELSKRELDVLLLVKVGKSSKEISQELDISLKTVEVHRYNILKKLNLKNTAALVNYAHQRGL